MPKVELIYDADCPHVEAARGRLRQALREISRPSRWTEWDRSDPASPPYARHYGSPTVLVDGRDIAGAPPVDGADCCRLYRDGHGRTEGIPPLSAIAAALRDGGDAIGGKTMAWQPRLLAGVIGAVVATAILSAPEPTRADLRFSIGYGHGYIGGGHHHGYGGYGHGYYGYPSYGHGYGGYYGGHGYGHHGYGHGGYYGGHGHGYGGHGYGGHHHGWH